MDGGCNSVRRHGAFVTEPTFVTSNDVVFAAEVLGFGTGGGAAREARENIRGRGVIPSG